METNANTLKFPEPAKLAMNSDKAGTVQEACAGRDSILEPKYDGIRLLVHVRENDVQMWARSGNEKSGKMPKIDAELLQVRADGTRVIPAGTWFDCEAVAFNEDGTQIWGAAQSCLGSGGSNAILKSEPLRLVAFDLLAHGGLDARTLPLRQRRELLEFVFSGENFERVQTSTWMAATDESHEQNLENGFEGSMVKHLDAPYVSNKRVKTSIKIKATDTVDGEIIGFGPGKPDSWIAKRGLIGKVIFRHWENGVEVEGKCSGMTVPVREWITANQDALIGGVIEVSYMTRMPGGKLRHPQFKRIRDDKTAAECRA